MTEGLVHAALERLTECARILTPSGALRARVPLLYLYRTLETCKGLDARATAKLCAEGGQDGLSLATWFHDVASSLLLLLTAADDHVASQAPAGDMKYVQILVQRFEQKLLVLHDVFSASLEAGGTAVLQEVVSAAMDVEDLLSSGDLKAFWKTHFPKMLRVGRWELTRALVQARGVEVATCEKLLAWMQFQMQGDSGGVEGKEIELADIALLLDSMGLAQGLAFASRWEDLVGHAYIAKVWAEHQKTRRATMLNAMDITLQRREIECTVLLPGWSREKLQRCRPMLLALTSLSLANACDCPSGLILQLEEAEVAYSLVPALGRASPLVGLRAAGEAAPNFADMVPGRLPDKLKEYVSEASKRLKSHERLGEMLFEKPVDDQRPSACVSGVGRGDAGKVWRLLSAMKARKLLGMQDFIRVFEDLDRRQRISFEQRVRSCDPSFRSDAWPKLQAALRDQRIKEQQVTLRKQQLCGLEEAAGDPDQIAHIRSMLHEVAEAEAEQEESRRRLFEQEAGWIQQESDFQTERRRRDLACRQRTAALIMESYHKQRQREEVVSQMMRIDDVLLELESHFATSRRRVHEYDQELRDNIAQKESFLNSLGQSLSFFKEQGLEANARLMQGEDQHERAQRLVDLQREKQEQLDIIEQWERKLEQLKAKHSVAVFNNAA
eukprot:TRINITY_DN37238_c0_g1_i1.p1 TRINITY_DN37238_c0_g1~~TRINITY_DN37238_c0_g1_i1.p1  ORF type:complete len:669 (+),score=202.16 TRINITY_DN37238_c0_g1_i1:121-2127(+)